MTGKQHGVFCESESENTSEMYDDRRCDKAYGVFCESGSGQTNETNDDRKYHKIHGVFVKVKV